MLSRTHKGRSQFRLGLGDGRSGELIVETRGNKTKIYFDLPKSVLIERIEGGDRLSGSVEKASDPYAAALAGTVWEGGSK